MFSAAVLRRRAIARAPAGALLGYVLFALLSFAAVWGCLALSVATGRIAVIWVANALCATAILKSPRRDTLNLLVIFTLADTAGNFAAGVAFLDVLPLALFNALEVVVLIWPLRRVWAVDHGLIAPRTVAIFYLLAAGPAPLIGAGSSVVYLWLCHRAGPPPVFVHWYLRDALGLVILMPILVTVRYADIVGIFKRRQLRGTLIALTGIALAIAINWRMPDYSLAYLFFPAVLMLTFTRGFAGGALGVLIANAYLLVPTIAGHGHIVATHPLHEQVLVILGFSAVLSFTAAATGAALAHRRRLEVGLGAALAQAEQAYEEALSARHAAENASRSKSMFLANMSHELRTPLNAVLGFSEVMRAQMFGPLGNPRYGEYAVLIHQAGSHLLDLINDILDMSKIEAGKFEIAKAEIEPREVIDECIKLVSERAAAGKIQLLCEVPAEPVRLAADRRALKQILLNLLSNAIKFTPEGGQVILQLLTDAATGRVIFRVRDTGVGIPQDAIAKLGNPFVQVRGGAATTHEGTGLGLALVRALTGMHEGTLKIESVLGAGTTVSVELPAGQTLIRAA